MTSTSPVARRSPAAVGAMAALWAVALTGCGGLDPVGTYQQVIDPAELYTALTIDQPAVNLSTVAPYDTLQLTATPRNALGEPMPGLPAPVFHLDRESDSTKVTVTPDGLLQAKATATQVVVIAELAVPGGSRFIDTTEVNVITTAPPPIASLSIHPVPPDSATLPMLTAYNDENDLLFVTGLRNPRFPAVRVLDAGGNPVSANLILKYVSSDPSIVSPAPGQIFRRSTQRVPVRTGHPGQVEVITSATVYGVPMADTLLVTVTWPALQSVAAGLALSNGGSTLVPVFQWDEVRIPPYGMVLWKNALTVPVDVTFDDPTNVVDPASAPAGSPPALACDRMASAVTTYGPGPHCGAGDVLMPENPATGNKVVDLLHTYQLRQFPVPGVYRYHSTLTGATGRVVVTTDPDPTALPASP